MHEFRSAMRSGDVGQAYSPVSTKEKCRRQKGSGGSLAGLTIAREERRATKQRSEERHRGDVERALLTFRRKKTLVRVVNISGSGVMVEADLVPRIGETVGIEFEGFDRLMAAVCWVKDGRIGLDLGEAAIELD